MVTISAGGSGSGSSGGGSATSSVGTSVAYSGVPQAVKTMLVTIRIEITMNNRERFFFIRCTLLLRVSNQDILDDHSRLFILDEYSWSIRKPGETTSFIRNAD
jgi:hypothetical protein